MGQYVKGGLAVTPIDNDGNILGTAAAPTQTSAANMSVVNTANSTTTNLAGGAVFTGTSVDITMYGSITVSVFSSHASAASGCSLQQSMDGTNWDLTDTYTIPATTGRTVHAPRQGRYFRLVYTNGATLTTSLRIQTIFNSQMPTASSIRPSDAIDLQNDFPEQLSLQAVYNGTTADLVRSVTNGLNSTGTGIQAAGLVLQLDDTAPTAPTENQFALGRMAPNRAMLTMPYASTAENWQYAAAAAGIVNTTTAVTIKAAAAAGFRNYIKSLDICTTGALGAATEFVVRDGAAGTVIYRCAISTAGLPAGRTILFDPPLRGTAATLLEVATLTASVTGGVYVNASGFIAP